MAAIALMGKAKNRLLKFYNPTLYKAPPKKEITMEEKIIAAGTSFAQVSRHTRVAQPEAPETGTYEKKTAKSGGVLALMDMLVKELESSLTEAQHEEKTAQATRASDLKSTTDKSSAKAELESKLISLKQDK